MPALEDDLNDKQRLYRDIFIRAQNALVEKLKTFSTKEEKSDFLKNHVSTDILAQINGIKDEQKRFKCACCATCCKIASSEFTYSQLKEKAKSGDNFAKSFLEVFVPYTDKTQAENAFPDYIELLKARNLYEDVNFYYCPKLRKDNLCTDYENRPLVCRDFPNNPLVIFPPKCSFGVWGEEFEVRALFLNAMIEIAGYFIEELDKEPA